MNLHKKIILSFIILLSLPSLGQGLITDRPDQTESSSTVPTGSLQIESGIFMGYSIFEGISTRQFIAPTTLFRYGITKGIELRLVNQFECFKNKNTSEKINGMNDIELGVKFQLLDKEEVNTQIAFLSHVIIPIGSEKLTNTHLGMVNKLAISHELTERVGIGYNVGYNYWGIGKGDFTYSVAFGISISENLGYFIETYGEMVEFKDHFSNLDTGFTYLLNDHFQLDISAGTGVTHNMRYLAMGFSWNIGGMK